MSTARPFRHAGIWSSPAVSQGTIYITGKDGQLLTFAPTAH